ncbi:MAG: putative epimerase YddE/YHI9, PhzF superfamily [Chloroflexi bacterium AL-W]|nr:putative epimerase YddE/YHI9, PhzF superfamily [Chloroflexi bacterium AL-N1]NOK66846.1 putative epimerase YddE/YHI9, PhzF superfamily [Chloroflexi bacterium AL-N10]NOK74862.1 putative epimerase YddE/YHI9, PhzF superfamily [Chloroflexi bacterium AL-N5]NOK81449.1 putative epimerase YddE/YHI9, PhzF superfamily [Chloroflexi bacterium AL-W]NOK88918.1 putative epimerase YddE/YHI9, PhzF superfamily [Chloroflexi bacterium AL-N15]
MKIPMYQVDAFASRLFTGNPAAVCVLDTWLDDQVLQAIAAENNLAETAFFTTNADGSYQLRWFTPSFEIPLCGHATLAAGFVLFQYCGHSDPLIHFHSKSGDLFVQRDGKRLLMDFPAYSTEPATLTDAIVTALGGRPQEFLRSGINYYAIYEHEDEVRALKPNYPLMLNLMRGTEIIGFVATAKGNNYDFVSRYLAPEEGTNMTEDPVTGSIHAALVPIWAARLGKTRLHAYQASVRGGELFCELRETNGDRRTMIGGYVQPYLEGVIEV